jgi:serine/threonine-protein kinase RsbW
VEVTDRIEAALLFSCAPRRSAAHQMRAALRPYLSDHGLSREIVNDVVLATEEALINAIMHSGDLAGMIFISARVRGGTVTVVVRDAGCGFEPERFDPDSLPDPARPRGRGLFLMHRLMDQVDVRCDERGTSVRMVRRAA